MYLRRYLLVLAKLFAKSDEIWSKSAFGCEGAMGGEDENIRKFNGYPAEAEYRTRYREGKVRKSNICPQAWDFEKSEQNRDESQTTFLIEKIKFGNYHTMSTLKWF